MTPEQKAEELVLGFKAIICPKFDRWNIACLYNEAKQCAELAVDEILYIMKEEYLPGALKIEYWERVKQAIKNYGTTKEILNEEGCD